MGVFIHCQLLFVILPLLQDIVRKIEKISTDRGDKPNVDVLISESGSLRVDTPFRVEKKEAEE